MPQGRINSYSQILDDPQVRHMGWVEAMELPSGVKTRTFGVPVKISGLDLSKRREPPALGATHEGVPMNPARLRRFIGDMTSLVGGAWQDKDETATVEVGAKLLGELVKNDDWLPEAMAECPPHGYVAEPAVVRSVRALLRGELRLGAERQDAGARSSGVGPGRHAARLGDVAGLRARREDGRADDGRLLDAGAGRRRDRCGRRSATSIR